MRGAVEWLSSEPRRQTEFEAVKEVFRFRKEASGAALRVNLNIENIEDLFSLAAASGRYPLSQSVSTAIAATLDYSRRHNTPFFFDAAVDKDLPIPERWRITTDGQITARCAIPVYDLY